MNFDRFMIAPMSHGFQTDLKPWLIPDDAFSQLNNAYVFRGRVRKRFGAQLMGNQSDSAVASVFSRLIISVGTTDITGHLDYTTNPLPGSKWAVGQMFYCDGDYFTVYDDTAGDVQMLRSDGSLAFAHFNLANGHYFIDGMSPSKPLYFFTNQPVMGFCNYEVGAINNQPSFAFDTQFVYRWVTNKWQREVTGTPLWHGDDTNFYWTTNWYGITTNIVCLFVTNFNADAAAVNAADDPLWYYDGTTWGSYSPYTVYNNAGDYIQTARLIIAFKDRLVLLNTIESNAAHTAYTAHTNRCRYSHNGSPFAGNAFLEPNQSYTVAAPPPPIGTYKADGAGWIDATTDEDIVSAEFIKNRLIVYFERSTWELVYTGNEVQPFVWQKINTELGSEATFSIVPFDQVVLGIGNTGIHACNGANTQRIDTAIPTEVFDIENKNEGVKRVAGIRDYYVEMVYWSFPSTEDSRNTYPDRVLVYNYRNNSWAVNDDCITAFGYFEQQQDATWASTTDTWQEANYSWSSGVIQAQFRQVLAGNQQGYTFLVSPDLSRNCPALQITNATQITADEVQLQIINHNLKYLDYIVIDNCIGSTDLNGNIYQVIEYVDADNVVIDDAAMGGVYLGGGTGERVSQVDIQTKQFNPYVNQNKNVYIGKVDFLVDKTSEGAFTVDYYPSTTNLSMLDEATATNSILGSGIVETSPYALYPLENEQERLWHPSYLQTNAEAIQLRIYLSDEQMIEPEIVFSDFQLHAMTLYTLGVGRLQ